MAEPMTPERRAEIERLNSKCHDSHDWQWHAFNELLAEMNVLDRLVAEIDRLNKVLDQIERTCTEHLERRSKP